MKKYSVYKLVNGDGKVEYVGRTTQPKIRLCQHINWKPNPGVGKFYGRTDITMEIVKVFDNVKDANLFEGELKLLNGMEWTERTTLIKNGYNVGSIHGKSTKYHLRKLDYNIAQEIRNLYFNHKKTQQSLANKFNISKTAVVQILINKTYTQE